MRARLSVGVIKRMSILNRLLSVGLYWYEAWAIARSALLRDGRMRVAERQRGVGAS